MRATGPRRHALTATAGAGALGILLVVAGRTLPLPPDLHPGEIVSWIDQVGPTVASFTALRVLGLGLLGWILTTALAGVAARRLHWLSLATAIDRISLPVVRRLAHGLAGVALVAASATGTVTAGAAPGPTAAPVVTMRELEALSSPKQEMKETPTTTTSTSPGRSTTQERADTAPVVMRELVPAPEPVPPASGSGPIWIIEPGDTLWHVAEQVASHRAGHHAGPSETLAELDRLVIANADRLVVPGNPDLVYPGQEFRLS